MIHLIHRLVACVLCVFSPHGLEAAYSCQKTHLRRVGPTGELLEDPYQAISWGAYIWGWVIHVPGIVVESWGASSIGEEAKVRLLDGLTFACGSKSQHLTSSPLPSIASSVYGVLIALHTRLL